MSDLRAYLQRMVPLIELELRSSKIHPVVAAKEIDPKELATYADILLTEKISEWERKGVSNVAYRLAKGIAVIRLLNPEFGKAFGL